LLSLQNLLTAFLTLSKFIDHLAERGVLNQAAEIDLAEALVTCVEQHPVLENWRHIEQAHKRAKAMIAASKT